MIVERLKFGIAGVFALFAKQDKEKGLALFLKSGRSLVCMMSLS